jgi:hypothetical protein
MDLGHALGEFRALEGRLLSGDPYTLEELERYLDLGADLLDDDEGAALMGVSLGKKKKKGFFKKITGGLKKVLKIVKPLLKTVVSMVMSKAGGGGGGGGFGGGGGGSETVYEEAAGMVQQDPNAGMAMAMMNAGVQTLQQQGIQMPPDVTAMNQIATQALQRAPSGAQLLREANEAAGLESGTPTWVYVAAGGGGLVLLGLFAILLMASGSSAPEALAPRRRR